MRKVRVSKGGKIILFGEHAVVYGYSAVAVPIGRFSYCTVQTNEEHENLLSFPDFNVQYLFNSINDLKAKISPNFAHFAEILETIANQFNVVLDQIHISVSSELWLGSGLGSSASTVAAFIQGLLKFYEIQGNSDALNELTYQSEKIVHGTPSGIDNTVIAEEVPIQFKNKKTYPINISTPFQLLVVNSGQPRNTIKAIHLIQDLHRQDPNEVEKSFEKIEVISEEGIKALNQLDLKYLGALFNENHKILQKLHLSIPKIEEIRVIAKEGGSYGSKLTGAGLGGSVIVIGEPKALNHTQQLLSQKGFLSFLTMVPK